MVVLKAVQMENSEVVTTGARLDDSEVAPRGSKRE